MHRLFRSGCFLGYVALHAQSEWPSDLFFFSCVKVLDVPLTVKIRTGVQEKTNIAHKLIPEMKKWGVSMVTVSHARKGRSTRMKNVRRRDLTLWLRSSQLHGRSREQRYTKLADWDYISTCSELASPVPLFGLWAIYRSWGGDPHWPTLTFIYFPR